MASRSHEEEKKNNKITNIMAATFDSRYTSDVFLIKRPVEIVEKYLFMYEYNKLSRYATKCAMPAGEFIPIMFSHQMGMVNIVFWY